jgi:hypothetical protein
MYCIGRFSFARGCPGYSIDAAAFGDRQGGQNNFAAGHDFVTYGGGRGVATTPVPAAQISLPAFQ